MTVRWFVAITLVPVALALAACGSSSTPGGGASGSADVSVASLPKALISASEAGLSGVRVNAPDPSAASTAATLSEQFTSTTGTGRLIVTLVASTGAAAAQQLSAAVVSYAVTQLDGVQRRALDVGTAGVQLTASGSSAKSAETDVYFSQGNVSVALSLTGQLASLPASALPGVARAQAAKLRSAH